MPRLLPPDPERMNEHQRRVYEAIQSGPRGRVRGPLAIWLHRPGLAEPAQALGQYCRYDSSLPPRLSELAILTIAALWRSEFEWWAHKPIAIEAGISSDIAEGIRTGGRIEFRQQDEQVVYEFVKTLVETRHIPELQYRRAIEVLGQDHVVDLVGLAGYYTLISMTLNVFEVAPADAAAPSAFGAAG
ncbi:carboxymuconolactone decarboxylase family protein [Paralcaligenes sp. KSB-10]|uniref:carboxymuconolactone decarboxylase family protein n=1 Tax=Paralcaligenes sp. KSB-10 TaxID=2901142 RepID=UPI001E3997DC|nr:carboxymuconolactone decarboxylase family protein [Paralcaligenes sp. KSB-10]UHL65273.1 carboxymuconolactone decarboxylase family protein [Paralcaligenes sp. KSB-10]